MISIISQSKSRSQRHYVNCTSTLFSNLTPNKLSLNYFPLATEAIWNQGLHRAFLSVWKVLALCILKAFFYNAFRSMSKRYLNKRLLWPLYLKPQPTSSTKCLTHLYFFPLYLLTTGNLFVYQSSIYVIYQLIYLFICYLYIKIESFMRAGPFFSIFPYCISSV